ncbi:MAG: endonuclease/exonuclease/phosphatase family protein [Myxococcaceae bacterium]
MRFSGQLRGALGALAFAALSLLASCPGPQTAVDGGCTPTGCEAEGVACGSLDDGCGATLECGPPCSPGPCDGGGCDGGDGGDGGALDAGPDAGPPDAGCPPESAVTFCARFPGVCGPVTGLDTCGELRTLDCDICAFPERCGDAGTCGCTPKSCAEVGRECGEAYDECGHYLDCGACPDGGAPPPHPLRIVAANTSSGNLSSYDPGEGIRIFQGLKPDLVLIQEFNYATKSDADIRRFVDQTFGPTYFFYREPGALQIPNGVISRYPIVAAGAWKDSTFISNRNFAWARIDVPGGKDLWAVSLHLRTNSSGNSGDRNAEASLVVGNAKAVVPAGDYLVVGGDLNTKSRTESCFTTFSQVVVTTGPFPVDQAGNSATSADRSDPYDWVMVNAGLKLKEVPVRIGANSFAAGLVFDSRVYSPLIDVAPVRSTDSNASNMQHMAVVRDFELP